MLKKITPLFIKNFLKRILNFFNYSPWANIYYSQNGEDIILKYLFFKKKKGFYVDVGAHHPERFSNTHLLYKKGWNGINIDAIPGGMKLFNKLRPRDINLEVGIGKKDEIIDFYVFNDPALNTFSKELAEKTNNSKNEFFLKKVVKVKVKRLETVLKNYLSENEIDVLNIDVEGLDLDVLESNDWSKYRPKFVLVEILDYVFDDLAKSPVVKFMREKEYIIYSNQINTVFFKNNLSRD